jgi:hypothetical protein
LSQRRFRITEFPTGLDAAVDGVALHYENLDHILVSQEFYESLSRGLCKSFG